MADKQHNKSKKFSPTFLALMDYMSKLPLEELEKACEVVRLKATIELIRRERHKVMS